MLILNLLHYTTFTDVFICLGFELIFLGFEHIAASCEKMQFCKDPFTTKHTQTKLIEI